MQHSLRPTPPHPTHRSLPPGILARSAPTFLRFGSIQFAARHSLATTLLVASMALERGAEHSPSSSSSNSSRPCFFSGPALGTGPHCKLYDESSGDVDHVFACLLEALTASLASLVAAWESVGFAHGVLNTDNLSLHPAGLTVDLNVFGFADSLTPPGGPNSPPWTPNFVDSEGLYALGARQRSAVFSGLERLGEALSGGLLEGRGGDDAGTEVEGWLAPATADVILSNFHVEVERCVSRRYRQRLGLSPWRDSAAAEAAASGWRAWLESSQADLHAAHKALSSSPPGTMLNDIEHWQGMLTRASGAAFPPERETLEHLLAAITEAEEGEMGNKERAEEGRTEEERTPSRTGPSSRTDQEPNQHWAPSSPTFVPRQSFLRRATLAADSSPGAGAHYDAPFVLARAAAALLKSPFQTEDEGRRAAVAAAMTKGASLEHAEWAASEAVQGLRALGHHGGGLEAWAQQQTSCGRQ